MESASLVALHRWRVRLFVHIEDGKQVDQRLVEVVFVLGSRERHLNTKKASGTNSVAYINLAKKREKKNSHADHTQRAVFSVRHLIDRSQRSKTWRLVHKINSAQNFPMPL